MRNRQRARQRSALFALLQQMSTMPWFFFAQLFTTTYSEASSVDFPAPAANSVVRMLQHSVSTVAT